MQYWIQDGTLVDKTKDQRDSMVTRHDLVNRGLNRSGEMVVGSGLTVDLVREHLRKCDPRERIASVCANECGETKRVSEGMKRVRKEEEVEGKIKGGRRSGGKKKGRKGERRQRNSGGKMFLSCAISCHKTCTNFVPLKLVLPSCLLAHRFDTYL